MNGKLEALRNKIKNRGRVTYQKPPEPEQSRLSPEQLQKLKNRRTTPVQSNTRQYGQPGYTPSTGRGVGH